MAFGGDDSSSTEIQSSLRPLIPPAAFASSKAIVAPARLPVPNIAAGPVRLPRIPTLISLSVTPASAALLGATETRDNGTETNKATTEAMAACFREPQKREALRYSMGSIPSLEK